MAIYTANAFSQLTGICPKTLRKWRRRGDVIPSIDGRSVFYEDKHLRDPKVIQAAALNGMTLPVPNSSPEIVKPVPPPNPPPRLKPVQTGQKKPKVVKRESETSLDALSKLPVGVVTAYFDPVAGLDDDARKIWRMVLPALIEAGTLHSGDVLALRDYCATGSQIGAMTETLDAMDFTLPSGRINPLVSELNKTKTLFRGLGNTLQLSPESRKSVKTPPKVDDKGAAAWAERLGGAR